MRTLESLMRASVRKALRGFHPISVENVVYPGTPDLNCTLGWIELKVIRELPRRPKSIVAVPHFTPQQRVWLTERWRADRKAWLLARVLESEADCERWLLWEGETAAILVGRERYDVIKQAAIMLTPNLAPEALISALQR